MTRTTEIQLTAAEKLIIWLLAEILKNQKDYTDTKRVELLQDIIYDGHLWALKQQNFLADEKVDSGTAVDLVYDTLDMWSFIESAYKTFSAEERKQVEEAAEHFGKDPKFQGFDGNNETEYLSITRFIVEKLGHFKEFQGRDFNSHMAKVNTYERIVSLFKPIRAKLSDRKLNPSEMITLLKLD